jgi:D-Ala-teichoic acid biosynthesis protein
MTTERSLSLITGLFARPWVRGAALTLYYLAILIGLIVLYGRGDFSTPSFIYQGF